MVLLAVAEHQNLFLQAALSKAPSYSRHEVTLEGQLEDDDVLRLVFAANCDQEAETPTATPQVSTTPHDTGRAIRANASPLLTQTARSRRLPKLQ